jgi:rhamnosyltransferase subunit B
MARIIIVAYGSLGDLHPVIALARGLKARGHHAAIATSETYRSRKADACHAVCP